MHLHNTCQADLRNKFDHRGCIQVHGVATMPLFVLICEVQRLQMPRHSRKHHVTLLAIESVVKQLVPDTASAASPLVSA